MKNLSSEFIYASNSSGFS